MIVLDAMQAYPLSPSDCLKSMFVDRSLRDVPTPAAIIDRAKAQHNCQLMLAAVKDLGVSFRAHVKTHKCTELTRMQVGVECKDVRVMVSTIIEAEQLVPLLVDYKSKGAALNVLYGVPLGPSQVERLSEIGRQLGQGSITVIIDHLSQLSEAVKYKSSTDFPISIFIKVDVGTHRAGINPSASAMAELVQAIVKLEDAGQVFFTGFYSHAGHSYSGSTPDEAMEMLKHEISTCQSTIQHISPESRKGKQPLTLSVGASPTALSIQNLKVTGSSSDSTAQSLKDLISKLTNSGKEIAIPQTLELHAGVYPLLDMQQLATGARPIPSDPFNNPIALTILTQIHSLYPPSARSSPQHEALIAAGSLALGREPCKSYPGWGIVSPWNLTPGSSTSEIMVSKISQEHGIISFSDPKDTKPLHLTYGQRMRIYPNHACIACAMYSFYLIVDSSAESEEERDRIVDVWVRWRGW